MNISLELIYSNCLAVTLTSINRVFVEQTKNVKADPTTKFMGLRVGSEGCSDHLE